MVKVLHKPEPGVESERLANHLLWVLEMERTINLAVRDAQEENRRLGIPNYYEVNGRLVSDQPEHGPDGSDSTPS